MDKRLADQGKRNFRNSEGIVKQEVIKGKVF